MSRRYLLFTTWMLAGFFGGAMELRSQDSNWLSGLTSPAGDATLSSSVPGVLGKYHFKEGDTVKKGDVILELENARERLDIQRQRLVVEAARKDYERTKKLFTDTNGLSVSKEEFDQKSVTLKVALADLDIAEEELSQRLIVAPFGGRIVDFFNLETGEAARTQAELVRLVDVSRCILVCHVPPSVADSVSEGAEVEVRTGEEGRNQGIKGRIIFVSSVLDPSTGQLTIKAEFDNKDRRFKPGFAASMRLTGKQAAGSTEEPRKSPRKEGEGEEGAEANQSGKGEQAYAN